ncbi:hypothetical protein [Yimella sp. cx-51]|uniref:hypothetical protein n=1 Tax=Yimella sp. cx-51 TaxID=2770551 RepID=UPI00165DF973|nr:hypothetical protein [Yimella sp. cx-51]MBC9956386.1 hypothetical protein [Yimella sp. cx-51]QTH38495.1 hypothetical protein J5M86_02120 [Yimella sp. cx-51]
MADQGNSMQGPEPTSPQNRYYERYMQPESGPSAGAGQGGPGNNKKIAIIAGGLAAALMVGVGVFALTRGGDDESAGSTTTTTNPTSPTSGGSSTMSSVTTSSSSSSSSTDPNVALETKYGPRINPGWRIIEGKETAQAVYEVPTGDKWRPKGKTYVYGWLKENQEDTTVVTSAPSTFDEGFCATTKSQPSGFTGFVNIGTRDPAEAAPDVVYKAARLIAYNKDTKKYAKTSETRTRQITVNGGMTTAVESLLVVDNGKVDATKCAAKKYEVRTVAFTGNGVSTMLLISRQQDGTSRIPDSDVEAILKSLRPKK